MVIGGANVDIKAKTLNAHIAATSNPGSVSITAGGVGRNIAHNLARLGDGVSLLSAIGKDANGDMVLAATKAAGVNVYNIIRMEQPTGIYLVVLNSNGELITAVNDMRLLTPAMIESCQAEIAAATLVVADCNLVIECLSAIKAERLIIEPVSVPKSQRLLQILKQRQIYLATPNLDQIEALTGTRNPESAAKILHKLGLQYVVIHAGDQGSYASDGKSFAHIPSQAKIIVDVTGAGDAATAGLVHGLLQNMPLAKAAEIGQEIAALVIAGKSSTLD